MKEWERYLLYAVAFGVMCESAARRMNDGQSVVMNWLFLVATVIPHFYFIALAAIAYLRGR